MQTLFHCCRKWYRRTSKQGQGTEGDEFQRIEIACQGKVGCSDSVSALVDNACRHGIQDIRDEDFFCYTGIQSDGRK